MVSYRYLGSALTNANGVATFDYEGTGAGEIDVIASLDKPITDGSIVSGTYSVFDCFFYDEGLSTEGHYNPNWHNQGNSVNVSRSPTETTLTQAVVGTTGFYQQHIQHSNYIIDFDYYCNVQDQVVSIRKDGNVLRWLYLSDWGVEADTWCHVKFVINGTDLRISVNDVERSYTLTDVPNRFVFRLQDNQEIKYKDFKMYIGGNDNIITINATNPIIQSTDSTTIKGNLYVDGSLMKNTDIDIYKNGTKVDTVNTGSTGTASYTYTGTGVGEVEFQFKYGSILSEPCSILDTVFYDEGKTGSPSVTWYTNGLTLERQADGSLLTCSETWKRITPISNDTYFTRPFAVEFDIVSITGQLVVAYAVSGGSNKYDYLDSTEHFKYLFNSDSITRQKTGGNPTTLENITGALKISLFLANTSHEVKIANFKVYPI